MPFRELPTKIEAGSGAVGFPQAFGAAFGVFLASYWGLGDIGVGVLTLVGYAIGDALDDWWLFIRQLGTIWRDAVIERRRRKYEKEFHLPLER